MEKSEISNEVEKIKIDFVIPEIKKDKTLINLIKKTHDHSIIRSDEEHLYRSTLKNLINLENQFQKNTYHFYNNKFIEYKILETVIGEKEIGPNDLSLSVIDGDIFTSVHLNSKIENDSLKQKVRYLVIPSLISMPLILIQPLNIRLVLIFIILISWIVILKIEKESILRNKYDRSIKKINKLLDR